MNTKQWYDVIKNNTCEIWWKVNFLEFMGTLVSKIKDKTHTNDKVMMHTHRDTFWTLSHTNMPEHT